MVCGRPADFPLEFPVMSLGEYNMRPTTMLYRNLMSMDVEESITANPLDGVVLLGGLRQDHARSPDGGRQRRHVPAILVTGGPQLKRQLARRTARDHAPTAAAIMQELRAGRISEDDWADLQSGIIVRSPGHCMPSWGRLPPWPRWARRLGIALPGNCCHTGGGLPAVAAGRSGGSTDRRTVVEKGLRPSGVLTERSFRKRHSHPPRHRRIDQRDRPPHRHRRPGRAGATI